ncbi:hypothetical protein A7K91_01860 [Paenibacillus oryzae]|uniref:DUF2577 domain-containing protein n=1 Tax=Paenibacillus oryzae TaxID=1844972 RepID=A0A1A5Y9Z4_9BACL|nr:DUF2577 domain-containing protein [Paenibacillus oryzae]OBR62388.1 hypothetical protein A7K91_01860 [Paenibacillus oryzae]
MSMLELIKKAGIGAVEAGNPVQLLQGEVVSANPLSVKVDQRFTLPADFLIVPESLTALEIDLSSGEAVGPGSISEQASSATILIRRGLEAGDAVILLRMQGGQRYLLLDRLVKP